MYLINDVETGSGFNTTSVLYPLDSTFTIIKSFSVNLNRLLPVSFNIIEAFSVETCCKKIYVETCEKLNAGISTQLLQTLFKVNGIVHYGIAGNADPQLQIGDVTIPQFWAHTGLWKWQV